MRFKLISEEHPDTGTIGWRDSRMPYGSELYGPLEGGQGMAHDMLEHFAFDSVADEIEAHGAMYWLRHESGWTEPKFGYSITIKTFIEEWENLLRGLMQESYLPTAPNTRRLDGRIEEDISSIIMSGQAFCIQNEVSECQRVDSDGRQDLKRLADVFRAYFRRGYRKAARRYRGIAAHDVGHTFNVLADALQKHAIEWEGQILLVNVDMRNGRVKIREESESL